MPSPRLLAVFAGLLTAITAVADPVVPPAPLPPREPPKLNVVAPAFLSIDPVVRLPMTKLPHAKLFPNLCLYRYRVSTRSEKCQEYVDQGFGFYYSYVFMEAARSFETALQHDPDCAIAWWGLSKSIEKWGRGSHTAALEKARDLMPKASDREKLLIRARLEEKGMIVGVTADDRVKKATATLDELLTLYDDDQEGWFARAQIALGTGAVPFYKSLLRLNPLHPGANHELVHFYENFKRPGLGWPYADAYIQSSPGIPHPYHMQAHLATRLGKWGRTCDLSARAIELERDYHAFQAVQPKEDQQYPHHLEILTISLVHQGRFAEARAIKAEVLKMGGRNDGPWFRLHRAERDWKEAFAIVDQSRKRDKAQAAYLAALLWLDQDETEHAARELDTLRQVAQQKKSDKRIEQRLWEVQGRYLCRTGAPDEGLKLIERCVTKTKDDFGHHSWGNGAYFMEVWGEEALRAGRVAVAEEAFLEALAHDPGSVRAALGMQMLCEKLGRTAEADQFARLAAKTWAKAESGRFDQLRESFAKMAAKIGPMSASVGER